MPIDKFGRTSAQPAAPAILQQQQPPHRFFKLTKDGDVDWENRRLSSVKYPEEMTDCVNKQFIDNSIQNLVDDMRREIAAERETHRLMSQQIKSIKIQLDAINRRTIESELDVAN